MAKRYAARNGAANARIDRIREGRAHSRQSGLRRRLLIGGCRLSWRRGGWCDERPGGPQVSGCFCARKGEPCNWPNS